MNDINFIGNGRWFGKLMENVDKVFADLMLQNMCSTQSW
jgi:hypothetical protein